MKKSASEGREGFSLIELIVVMAIMALFVGIASLSVGLLRGTDTRGLASKIDNSLGDLKSMTQAHRGPYYLYVYRDGDSYYAGFSDEESFAPADFDRITRLGSSSMTIETDTGALADGDYREFTIQKKDGAYRGTSNGAASEPPKYLQIKKGDDATPDYTVVIAKNTGLHYVYQGQYPKVASPEAP